MFAHVSKLETLQNAPEFEDMTTSNQKLAKMELEKWKSRKKALASQLSQSGLSVHKIIETTTATPPLAVRVQNREGGRQKGHMSPSRRPRTVPFTCTSERFRFPFSVFRVPFSVCNNPFVPNGSMCHTTTTTTTTTTHNTHTQRVLCLMSLFCVCPYPKTKKKKKP